MKGNQLIKITKLGVSLEVKGHSSTGAFWMHVMRGELGQMNEVHSLSSDYLPALPLGCKAAAAVCCRATHRFPPGPWGVEATVLTEF